MRECIKAFANIIAADIGILVCIKLLFVKFTLIFITFTGDNELNKRNYSTTSIENFNIYNYLIVYMSSVLIWFHLFLFHNKNYSRILCLKTSFEILRYYVIFY